MTCVNQVKNPQLQLKIKIELMCCWAKMSCICRIHTVHFPIICFQSMENTNTCKFIY